MQTAGEGDRFRPWSINIDTKEYDDGEMIIEARAVRGGAHSFADSLEISIENEGTLVSRISAVGIGAGIVGVIAAAVVGMVVFKKYVKK